MLFINGNGPELTAEYLNDAAVKAIKAKAAAVIIDMAPVIRDIEAGGITTLGGNRSSIGHQQYARATNYTIQSPGVVNA